MTTFILDGIWGGHSRWERLRSRIEKSIGPCRIWRYDNSGHTSLEALGAGLREELHAAGGPLNVVGYSMGGLVIREALRMPHELPVRRAVFLHSPHRGSLFAHAYDLPACREMRPGSAFLTRLNEGPWNIPTLATWCALDAVVVPGQSACWKAATTTIQSPVPAHAWPVISPAIHKAVVGFLQASD
ncbi:MAG: alpha/beta fold hydrolase [Verrucomicrobia bacterium]|nr:alpha/beta fold hydrolase [Verrucomicrobiota bacterium]